MDRRLLTYALLVMILFWVNLELIRWWKGPPPQPEAARLPLEAPPPKRTIIAKAPSSKEEKFPRRFVALGSADPQSPYRMVAVLSSRGGSVEWVGLNSPQYRDLDARFEKQGFLGYLALTDEPSGGARVNAVGAGTPAHGDPSDPAKHLQPGDVITYIGNGKRGEAEIASVADLEHFLRRSSRIGDQVEVRVLRNQQPVQVGLKLGSRPLEVVKPELGTEPKDFEPSLSFLLTLAEVDGQKLEKEPGWKLAAANDGVLIDGVDKDSPADRAGLQRGDRITKIENVAVAKQSDVTEGLNRSTVPTGAYMTITYFDGIGAEKKTKLVLPSELPNVRLYDTDWNIPEKYRTETGEEKPGTDGQTYVRFEREVPAHKLKVVKHYELAKREEEGDLAYHLTLKVQIINIDSRKREVAYQMDGPQGLPTEGWWYSNKVSRTSGAAGARDLVYRLGGTPVMFNGPDLAAGSNLETVEPKSQARDFFAVDTRYFAVAVVPQITDQPGGSWVHMVQPLVVGSVPADSNYYPLVNTSFRLISKPLTLEPGGANGESGGGSITHSYLVFLGPKDSNVLSNEQYQLEELIYYGWPIFAGVAWLMTGILHVFYWIIPNYGVAVILLTVLVRACMFPLSRKQAIGAQKMQMLQPELKRLAEKYKNNVEQRMKAQRELFRKHNYNPMGGCLPIFLQLPIFIGLYKGLSADIELRQSPLIPGFYWCSDLSAPDRLLHWAPYMPDFLKFLTSERGFLSLGPYFNLLPILTIVVFLWHQKLFMPPPTDEQQVLQQKMMKYMMILMGFMFFTVPSGLCIYFIASSLWGLAERKLLPKMAHQESPKPVGKAATPRPAANGGGNFAHDGADSKKKRKKRRSGK